MANNYTLGRGKLYFARYNSGTTNPGGERYLGNTPSLTITLKEETLDHYSSDAGVKEKDGSISLQVDRTIKVVVDNIDLENLALFFFGSTSTVTTVSASNQTETIAVKKGLFYQLGISSSSPSGIRKISNLVVKKGATTLVSGTDYTANADLARVEILASGTTITDNDSITFTYDIASSTHPRVISGSTAIEGALHYIADNPKGTNYDYYFPDVKLSPDGEFELKGDSFMKIPFTGEILKKDTSTEAIYIDGRPA